MMALRGTSTNLSGALMERRSRHTLGYRYGYNWQSKAKLLCLWLNVFYSASRLGGALSCFLFY